LQDDITYDLAIVGGGLAGLALSIQTVKLGYKVILFEKEQYPFHKVCGEYVSLESWDFVQRLGVDLPSLNVTHIKKLQVSDIKGVFFEQPLPLGGFGISRYKLDHILAQIAKQAEVIIHEQIRVNDIHFSQELFTIESTKGNFTAKVVAGSFGKRSNLDVKWTRDFIKHKPGKLNQYIAVKYHIHFPFPKEKIALHNFENGYCGISNIENGTCCLCYLTTANTLKKNNNSIAQMEQNILWQNPLLKEIFTKAKFLYSEPLVISQVSFANKKQVEDHVLMIGDAAGLVTPLCGNGMSMAMHASRIAFENVHAMLQQKINRTAMEINYSRQWQKQFSKRLWIGRIVQRLFGNNTSTSTFLKLMHKTKWLAKKIIRATHGEPF